MNPKTRIKVQRGLLIEAIRARKEAVVAENAKAREKHALEAAQYAERVETYLRRLIERVREGETISSYDIKLPQQPYLKETSTDSYDRAIQQLEMAAEDVITITAEDFAAYVR